MLIVSCLATQIIQPCEEKGKATEKWPVHGAVSQEVVVIVIVIHAALDQVLREFLTWRHLLLQ